MRGTYDKAVDALALRFSGGRRGGARVVTHEGPHGVNLDFADGKLVGIEVLDASAHFTAEQIAKLVTPDESITPAMAADEYGLEADTWKRLCQQGRLAGAAKKGRDWFFPRASAVQYLVSRDESGRGRPPNAAKARRKVSRAIA